MRACDLASALGDPVRLRILEILHRAPSRVHEIAANFPISRPAISRHLRVLRRCRLVDLQPSGRETVYSLVPDALAPLEEVLQDLRSDRSLEEAPERKASSRRLTPRTGAPQASRSRRRTAAARPRGEVVDGAGGDSAEKARPKTDTPRVALPTNDWRAW